MWANKEPCISVRSQVLGQLGWAIEGFIAIVIGTMDRFEVGRMAR